jgi:hypothetical protein
MRGLLLTVNLIIAMSFAGCGGGSSSPVQVNASANATSLASTSVDYLKKYQGTWIQQCATPIKFSSSPDVYGPGSSRKKLVISAPNATGIITIDAIEDFYDKTVGCYDYAAVPKVSLQESIPSSGSFVGTQTLSSLLPNTVFDILNITQPESSVVASGTGTSTVKVTINGAPKWRITFSDGKNLDQDALTPAFNGEIGFRERSALNSSGIKTFELELSGDSTNPYSKQ